MNTSYRLILCAMLGLASQAVFAARGPSTAICAPGKSIVTPFALQKITCGEDDRGCAANANSKRAEFKVIEGANGPEVQMGEVRIYLDPSSVKGNPDSEGKSPGNNRWCIVDANENKKNRRADGYADCGRRLAQQKIENGNRTELNSFTIPGTSLKVTPTESEDKGVKVTKLIMEFDDGRGLEKMILNGMAEKRGNETTSRLNIQTSGRDGKVNGTTKSEISGMLKPETDEISRTNQFASCKSPYQELAVQAGLDRSGKADFARAINGACYTMLGSDHFASDVSDESCRSDGLSASLVKSSAGAGFDSTGSIKGLN